MTLEDRLRQAQSELHRKFESVDSPPFETPQRPAFLSHGRFRAGRVAAASALVMLTFVGGVAVGYWLLGGSDPTPMVTDEPSPPRVAVCPTASTPDKPGPVGMARPPSWTGRGAFDRQSGRLIVESSAIWPRATWTYDADTDTWGWATKDVYRPGGTWAFDVCTNTWEEMFPASAPPDPYALLVYDAGSDLVIAIAQPWVWTYDFDTNTWTEKAPPPDIPWGVAEYDPLADLVVVVADESTWTYDVDRDIWTEKTGADLATTPRSMLMVHDPTVAAMVVWVEDDPAFRYSWTAEKPGEGLATWTYDVSADLWTRLEVDTKGVNTGYGVTGGLFAHHEGSGLSVMYSAGQAAIFDAGAGRWQHRGFPDEGWPEDGWVDLVVYDPVNDRILVIDDGLRAHNPATGEWTSLLEPSEPSEPSEDPVDRYWWVP